MLKKLLSVFLIMAIFVCFLATPTQASIKNDDISKFSIVSTNLSTNQRTTINLSHLDLLAEKKQISQNEFSETYEGIFEIDKENNITLVDSVPPMPRSSQESSEENVYWKATVKIVYSISGDTVVLTKVEGSWYQCRGTTVIVYREVSYGQMALVKNNDSGLKYPTSNSFSYNTGFQAGRYITNKSVIGANTLMKYRRTNTSTEFSLAVSCDKNF